MRVPTTFVLKYGRRMAAPRRHLALVCFLHQAWRDTLD